MGEFWVFFGLGWVFFGFASFYTASPIKNYWHSLELSSENFKTLPPCCGHWKKAPYTLLRLFSPFKLEFKCGSTPPAQKQLDINELMVLIDISFPAAFFGVPLSTQRAQCRPKECGGTLYGCFKSGILTGKDSWNALGTDTKDIDLGWFLPFLSMLHSQRLVRWKKTRAISKNQSVIVSFFDLLPQRCFLRPRVGTPTPWWEISAFWSATFYTGSSAKVLFGWVKPW